MPQSESSDVGRDGYDTEVWEEAVQRVEDPMDKSTAAIHDEVVEIFHERGAEDDDEIPSYRTTFTKLENLRKEGKITKREVANSSMWVPETKGMRGRVLRTLRDRESGTVEKVAEDLGGVDVNKVKDALRELKEEGDVESEEIGSKEIWAPLE
jgi:hypothetical protein